MYDLQIFLPFCGLSFHFKAQRLFFFFFGFALLGFELELSP
jgi:hypothetical protein